MERIKRNLPYLRLLCKRPVNKDVRKHLLQSEELIKILSEISLNILNGNIRITEREKKRLRRYKTLMRLLARKSVSLNKKRSTLVNQKGGGFFLPLLAPLITLISSAIAQS